MSESVIDLAAAHLKRQFLYQTQRGRFGNRDAVLELAISARGCAASAASQPRIMLAFVLERVLDQWAKHLGGRPISLSETAHLSGRLQQPIPLPGIICNNFCLKRRQRMPSDVRERPPAEWPPSP